MPFGAISRPVLSRSLRIRILELGQRLGFTEHIRIDVKGMCSVNGGKGIPEDVFSGDLVHRRVNFLNVIGITGVCGNVGHSEISILIA
jgi:hypothetical protein